MSDAPAPNALHILYARWRTLRNFPKSQSEGGWLRLVVLLVLGVLVWAGIFAASTWFLQKTLALEPFGEILARKLLGLTLMVIFAVLLFSSVITAFSTFLLADELSFLMVRPLPPNAFFTARFAESALVSSWMVVLFGLPVFLAAGIVFHAQADYYVWLVAVLAPFIMIPSALAVIVVLLLANTLPVQRTREVLLGLGAMAFVAVFVMMRSLQPERLLNPGGFGSTMEFFATLQTPGRFWLPSSWAIEALYPRLQGDVPTWDLLPVACLFATASGLYFVAAWLFRGLHARAYSRAQQGRHNEVNADRAGWSNALSVAPQAMARWQARERRKAGRLGPTAAIAWKDLLVFNRDTVQWSQMLLLAGLVVIYLVNFQYIGAIGKGGIFGPIGVYFLNIGLSGFLVAAVSVRIVFPAVSMEGKAFWLVRRAPLGLRRYLLAKWLGHTPHLLILAEVLTFLSHWMLGIPVWLTAKSMLMTALLAVSLTGLGIGMGAMFPRFHIDNAAKVATGIGGVLFMLVSLALTLVIMAIDAYPTYHLLKRSLSGSYALPIHFWWKAAAAWGGVLALALGAAVAAVALGVRRLEAH